MRRFTWLGLCLVALFHPLAAWAQPKPTAPSGGQKPPGAQATLTPNETQRLMDRLAECWAPPANAYRASNLVVTVRMKFTRDGSLAEPPKVLNSSPDPGFAGFAKSTIAALTKCAPFSFLPAAK